MSQCRHRASAVLAVAATLLLAGCERELAPVRPPALVKAEIVKMVERRSSITLTGDVQARVQADLAFRVTGRVIERRVEVGAHVAVGDVLARIDPAEQQADVDAATAAVSSAEAQLRVARSNFGRQQTLLSGGFTTRAAFDQAEQSLRTAEGSLETAKAQLGTAKDALGYTELRADAAGIITARNIEVGQVAQVAQPAFSLAHDGARDAVFDVFEAALSLAFDPDSIKVVLVSDPGAKASGRLREVSPTIDQKTGTVRVKIAIDDPPQQMALGSPVTVTASLQPQRRAVLPAGALAAVGTSPAVWIVDPRDQTVSLKTIAIDSYDTGSIVVASGLADGERVVVDGGKLLSPGQVVSVIGEGGS